MNERQKSQLHCSKTTPETNNPTTTSGNKYFKIYDFLIESKLKPQNSSFIDDTGSLYRRLSWIEVQHRCTRVYERIVSMWQACDACKRSSACRVVVVRSLTTHSLPELARKPRKDGMHKSSITAHSDRVTYKSMWENKRRRRWKRSSRSQF